MPTLSCYWFDNTDFRGNTEFLNIQHPAGGWAWINWSDIGSKKSTLTWDREDREVTYDLVALLNTPLVLNLIDNNLGSQANRTSQLNAGWIPWRDVSYYYPRNDRGDLDLLIKLSFNFHVSTPWYCSDADGYIEYMIVTYLDTDGHLHAYVDGWDYHFDGGSFCSGSISDALNSSVPGAIGQIQTELNTFLGLINSRQFDMVYYLPGTAGHSGSGSVDVDNSISIALLPR
jgi:hypothetical protein